MIYNRNNETNYNESVALFGNDADKFLESVEVSLYEDTITIGENTYDGAEAEEFLAESGIYLYEDHIVLEGKQADEYLRRKQNEYDKKKNDEKERYANRYVGNFPGNSTRNDPRYKKEEKLREYKKRYPNVGPKSMLTKSERESLNKKEERDHNAYANAFNTLHDHLKRNFNKKNSMYANSDNHLIAMDAAERHYRRHPKNESTIFDFDLK